MGCKILKRVRSDLRDVIAICRGEKKQTNDHRAIIADLNRGMIPTSWILYKIPSNSCTVIQWINDFVQRVKQLETISSKCSQNAAASLRSDISRFLENLLLALLGKKMCHD